MPADPTGKEALMGTRLLERPQLLLLGGVMTWLLFAPTADAHRAEPKKEPIQRHGGVVKRAGTYNIEWVYEDACVKLYVHSTANIPLPSSGGKAKAEVFMPTGKKLVELSAGGGNRFSNCVDGPFKGVRMVIVTLKIYGEKQERRLFTVNEISAAN